MRHSKHPSTEALLPLNREERFWTATVFPALAVGSELERLPQLVELLHLRAGLPKPTESIGYPDAFVLTEYSIQKSWTHTEIAASDGYATPDILLIVTGKNPAVFTIEAKMFDSIESIAWQLVQQELYCATPIAEKMEEVLGSEHVPHYMFALVPEPRADAARAQGLHVMSWTDVLALGPGEGYFHDMLGRAIAQYDQLTSKTARTHEGGLKGNEIVRRAATNDNPPHWIGAGPGRRGNRRHLESGDWGNRTFVVNWTSEGAPATRNWMKLDQFLAATKKSES